jgi:hypothetical protein
MALPRSKTTWFILALPVVLLAAIGLVVALWAMRGGGDGRQSSIRQEFEAIADELDAHGLVSFFGARLLPGFLEQLQDPNLPLQQVVNVNCHVSRIYLAEGMVDESLAAMDRVFAAIAADPGGRKPSADLYLRRAIVYLRQAEVENCIKRHNSECCIFPLEGGAVHVEKQPAQRAYLDYLAAAERDPGDLRPRWLLNLARMAVGDHPEGVPPQFVIPPDAFESDYDIKRFPDIAIRLGVDTFNRCGGAIAEDFDRDGLLDIVTSTLDPRGPITYYRNLGERGFEDLSVPSRLADQLGGLNCIGADYDNDGDVDILVLRGAWFFDSGRIRNSLLRNDSAPGSPRFTDVTREAGVADPARPTQAAVWADFDDDGDLDLYIGNESRLDQNDPVGDYPSQLFRNNGDGTFTDIARQAGVTNDRYAKGVTAGDYDNDGDMDLYVSNGMVNRLYRNDGGMSFTDVAPELGLTHPEGLSFATWFFDVNNDGWLDLFVVAYDATVADLYADYLGREDRAADPALYLNNGDPDAPGFTDVAERMDLHHPYLPMGANFGDLDNDGWLDMYLTTGEPDYQSLMPNVMLRNDAGERYQDVSKSGGFGHLQKGHGVAFADLDNDGDQDIYHQLGGFYAGDVFHNALFHNPGHGNRFLTIRLVGTSTNRMAIGARIKVVVDTPDGPRAIHRAVGSVSSFGGSPFRQEIGLGNAIAIDRVEITWPTSRTHQVLTGVTLDSMILVTEGETGFEALHAPRYDLGRAPVAAPAG